MACQLLPFRFERFNEKEYLLTNEVVVYIYSCQIKIFNALLENWMNIVDCSMALLPSK